MIASNKREQLFMAALSRWVIQVLATSRESLLDEIDYTFDCLKDSFERNNLFKTILSNTGRLDIPKRDIDTCDPVSLLSRERLNPWLDQSPYRQVSTSIIQWRIQGRGPGGPAPPLALVYTEAWRAQKFFLRPPPPPLSLSEGMDPPLLFFICLFTLKVSMEAR